MSHQTPKSILSLTLATALLCTGLAAHADDDNPYAFMGACQSQGSWTQAALQQTETLRTVILKLKSNPNCNAVNLQMSSLLEKLQANAGASSAQTDTTLNDRRQLSDLKTFASNDNSGTALKNPALGMMVEGALRAADHKAAEMSTLTAAGAIGQAGLLRTLGTHADQTITQSLSIFNQLIDKLPDASTCLDNASRGAFAGAFLAGSAKLLSTFAVDENHSYQVANSISKLFNYMRQKKYAQGLIKINEIEFRQSLSCLLEVTTNNYCATSDAGELVNLAASQMQIGKYVKGQKTISEARDGISVGNPLTGFMIISNHIPNITNWLLNVQIGISPQTHNDSEFKNTHLDDMNNFFKATNLAVGKFNEKKLTLLSFSDLKTQQQYLSKAIQELAGDLLSTSDQNGKTNFYGAFATGIDLPFKLLNGVDAKAPDDVLTSGGGRNIVDVPTYLNANRETVFPNPVEQLKDIEKNLDEMNKKAYMAAIQSYNQWLIADPATIVMDSAAQAPYSVMRSLDSVDKYLAAVELRIQKAHSDEAMVMLPAIQDTRARIQAVLASFRVFNSATPHTQDENKQLWTTLVTVAYSEFNILLSRASFLQNRLSRIVYFDYIHNLKNNPNISQYQSEIIESAYKASFDQVLGMSNANFSQVESDLKNAQYINLRNLEVLETVFKRAWTAVVARTRLESEGKGISDWDVSMDSVKRAFTDPLVPFSTQNANPTRVAKINNFSPLTMFWNWAKADLTFLRLAFEREKYPFSGILGSPTRTNSMARSDLEYLYSEYCTQSLAFQSWRDFIPLCKNAELVPFYLRQAGITSGEYTVNFMKKAQEGVLDPAKMSYSPPDSTNTYKRVCALRDYYRRNNVLVRIIKFKDQQQ